MNDTTFRGDGKITYVPVVVNTKPPKQTNADRIRAMTDEELAIILAYPSVAEPPWCACYNECPHISEDPTPCDKCALDWLKQEV